MITSLGNFSGIQMETDIAIITLDDNKTHTYCSKISWEKDNSIANGSAKITMPYDTEIEKYWSTYSGTVIIHANLNEKDKIAQHESATIQQMPTKTKQSVKVSKNKKKIVIQNDNYNYSFIGKVNRFKHIGKTLVVFLEDLGWKFTQKVPDEFRKSYIAGQTLDDAFQAICEFMGVEFAYSIEDLSKCNFSSDGYSVEKDGALIEDVPTIFEDDKPKNDEDEEGENLTEDEKMAKQLEDGQPFEASGLMDYKNKQKQNQQNNENTNENDKALNQETTNQSTNQTTEEQTEEEKNAKIEKYQEEFDKKIEDLFKGNTLYNSNISDPILNYNWITIQPKAVETTEISSSDSGTSGSNGDSQNSNSDPNSQNNGQNGGRSNNQTQIYGANRSLQKRDGYDVSRSQMGTASTGKKVLTKEYINSISPDQARALRQRGLKTGEFTDDTMQKLLWRSIWITLK